MALIKSLNVPVTLTVGVSTYPEISEGVAYNIDIADKALIRGKRRGKNNISMLNNNNVLIIL